MSVYIVQPGDTPMIIAQKMTGNPARVGELVRSNAHKPAVAVGPTLTFRELFIGEHLTIPPTWKVRVKKTPTRGVGGYAVAQQGPHFHVAPRAGGDGDGVDGGYEHEPILTVSGPHGAHRSSAPVAGAEMPTGVGKACCGSCARGGPCESTPCCQSGGNNCVKMPTCSVPSASPSVPGSTSFPVGFGRGLGQATSTTNAASTVGDALAGWGVPLTIGVISIAAGFGLAYIISNR